MKMLSDVAGFAMRRRGGPTTVEPSRAGGRGLRRLIPLWVLVPLTFGALPAVASGGTLPGLPIFQPQPPWWSYLPGMGSSGLPVSSTPPSPTPTSSLPGTLTNASYSSGSGTLAYQLYVPSTYKAGTAMPLVVALHGCTQTADVFRQLTRWDQLAQQKGFIVVFPQQSSSNNYLSCWNFFQAADMSRGTGEPALIAGITQSVQQQYGVDKSRTYVAGLSAGGAMSSVMAATYPDLY